VSINGNPLVNPNQGLIAAVHNLAAWSSVTLPGLFVGSPTIDSFITQDLNVNTLASNGFPGMPTSLQNLVGLDGYSLDINGFLDVPTTGNYVFKLTSDDGAILLINDEVIISDDSLHAPHTSTSLVVRLNKGLNRINVLYYQGPLSQIALQLKWSGPNLLEQVVPSSVLTH